MGMCVWRQMRQSGPLPWPPGPSILLEVCDAGVSAGVSQVADSRHSLLHSSPDADSGHRWRHLWQKLPSYQEMGSTLSACQQLVPPLHVSLETGFYYSWWCCFSVSYLIRIISTYVCNEVWYLSSAYVSESKASDLRLMFSTWLELTHLTTYTMFNGLID